MDVCFGIMFASYIQNPLLIMKWFKFKMRLINAENIQCAIFVFNQLHKRKYSVVLSKFTLKMLYSFVGVAQHFFLPAALTSASIVLRLAVSILLREEKGKRPFDCTCLFYT